MRRSIRDVLCWLVCACALAACAPIPAGRYTLEKISFTGNHHVGDDSIQPVIASQPSAKFLGLWSGVIYDYAIFDRYVLERDLQRIERYYRARGYYQARVRAARVTYHGRGAHVEVEIEEGPPVLLRRVDIHGLDGLPPAVVRAARAAVLSELPLDRPFQEAALESGANELAIRIKNAGHAYVEIRRSADVDIPRGQASVGYCVDAGPRAEFGEVRIEGLGPLPEPPVRRAINIAPGDPYSQFELDEAKRALLDLNVFGAVSVEPNLTEEQLAQKPTQVPILVKVEPSKLRSVHLGVGVELDTHHTDFHLIAGWEDNNFLGGFRRFLVEAVPGVVLYPTRLPDFQRPRRLLPEGRLRTEFRQPGFLEARTNALVRTQLSVAPLLLSDRYDPAAAVLGYQDFRASAGLERSYWRVYGTLTQNFQVNSPFVYRGPRDPALGPVVISYPELFLSLDLRNDRVTPHKGAYFSLDTQVAGVGGDARDVKLQPEARGYVPLARKWTLAARATTGFLFAQNYGQTIAPNAELGRPNYDATDDYDRRPWDHDLQLMFLRGFFSGGSGSNRGYGLRDIGPHGYVPFYNPVQYRPGTSTAVPTCPRKEPGTPVSPECNLPLGGFTLWEASLELRFPISGPISGTVFGDSSDVAPRELEFRFRPHLSVGLGLRYDTPIGPVRFDVGYRVPGLQYMKKDRPVDEGDPVTVFGLPMAASFGIGETF